MERFYEVMFIVRPDIEDADVDKLIAGFEQTIINGGGTLRSTEKLGRRKLAYTVRKFNDGNYVLLTVDADGKLVAELERRLRVSEPVIKFITVRMDEEEKRLNKIKAIRATRKKVSAQPPAGAPVPAAAAAPAPVESAEAPAEATPASA
jgi:small subunit ribosomal protein S6